ncbi:MalY/PatB family protein [Oceanospirillum sediminis]|uniref:cysteine-S-conjugate beta-lyase n=1 Tax=Oceanospirillum sediminis TaxID=2760088 RepID=A0A839ITE4_9GAMM|nr:PatB family C-S lyase [Oceanospirillum sediminis]MBB1488238.1 putative C-S lyase [Oceanospirillum sediminis]
MSNPVSETSHNFDQILRRDQTDSIKWQRYQGQDVIPMWIADMDFASPDAVIQALQSRVAEGVFGYGSVSSSMKDALCGWYARHHNWVITPESIVWLPGLVCGLHAVARAFAPAGQSVMTHTPVYPPFLKLAERNQNHLQTVAMREPDAITAQWTLDIEAMQAACTSDTRLFMFCNPHNPTGRVFTEYELQQIADFCLENNLLICSDEIHCDLVLDQDKTHRPVAALNDQIAARSVTLVAPSKTFNIAGLACSAAIIPDRKLRQQFKQSIQGFLPEVNILGLVAAEAAFQQGDSWRCQLIDYLRQNRQQLKQWVDSRPELSMAAPEATYLGWIDCRTLEQEVPARYLLNESGVALSEGADFGLPGFVRINFGCPAAQLEEALQRLDRALTTRC